MTDVLNTRPFRGGRTNTSGLCPSCGDTVPRIHQWSPFGAADRYACPACGTFEYATDGVQMPPTANVTPTTIGHMVDVIH